MELDIEHLLSMTGEDVDLAEEVLDIFRGQAEVWGRLLDPKLPPQQWADAAHTIKGAALSIGAHELSEACAEAETLGRSGAASPTSTALALDAVRTNLNQTLEACARASHALSKPGLRASNAPNS